MTKKEMDDAIKRAEIDFNAQCKAILGEYAISNNPVTIGDIVDDGYHRIIVDKMSWRRGYCDEYPSMVYKGVRIRKDEKPFKSGERGYVYQANMKDHIKNED